MSYTVDFNSGTDGATVAVSGAVSAIAGTPVYENSPSAHGGMAARFSSGTVTTCIRCNTSPSTHTGSFYMYLEAENDTNIRVVAYGDTANTITQCNIRLKTARTLTLADSATVDKAIGTTVIPLNQWVRIDYQFDVTTPTAPVLTTRLFLNAEGTVYDEQLTYTFTGTTGTFGRVNFGISGSASVTNRKLLLDTIRVTDGVASWPAPFNPPPPAGLTAKLWNGTAEVAVTNKLWNGTAEVAVTFKLWNGSAEV